MNKQELSALLDDELEASRRGQVLDQLIADADLKRAWGRYHLIGEVLRDTQRAPQRGPERQVVQLTSRTVPTRAAGASTGPVRGWAIAASVAVLVVLAAVTQRVTDEQAPNLDIARSATPPPQISPAEWREEAVLEAPAQSREAHAERLNGYLVNFNEQRSRIGIPGVHPYVRIVGYETE